MPRQPRIITALHVLLPPAMLAAMYMVFVYAPTEKFMGDVQRIFYVHLGSAWNAYMAFLLSFVVSLLYLWTRNDRWDKLAAAGVEVGVLFTTATLASGIFWARSAWGFWWTWEPRLTTTLIMWLMYVAYLILRQSVDEPGRRARISAVFGVLAFITVPIVHMSVQWWRTIHPWTVGGGKMDLHPDMWLAALVMVGAFTLLNAALVYNRYQLSALQDRLAALGRGAWRP